MHRTAWKTTVSTGTALAVGLSLTAAATWWQARENRLDTEDAVRAATERVAADVTQRLYLYQYGVRGLRGAILTAGEIGVSHALLERYSESRDIDVEFPGARGFGFVRRVPIGTEKTFLTRVRAGGPPGFDIYQLEPSAREPWVIEFIAPYERNAAAFGLDIASDPNRREAAEISMRTGQTTITAPIVLMQNPDKTQKSFLLMMPVYRPDAPSSTPEEREANTFGWTYAALSMNDVMGRLPLDQRQLHLVLRDVTRPDNDEFIYETQHLGDGVSAFNQRVLRTVFGRQWMIEVSAHPEFVANLNLTQPRSVATIGLLASLLLAAFIGAESISRRRKHVLALQMADFNAQLEREVVERTEELTQAKAAAEAANAAKGRFLAIMSHELRTPMAGVLGIGELLMNSDLNAEQQRLTQTLMSSARSLLDLLNDILDFAKIEAGRVDLEEVDFSVRQVVDDVRQVFAPVAAEKVNVIDTKIDDSLSQAQRGDAKRYRQILMNLVSNANKFTKSGRISIEVHAAPERDGQILIKTTVRDTGVGIAPGNRDRLFQPFVQEDTSTSRKFGGTGLGLAISKTLAELMGGRIWLESEPGIGSAFSFTVLMRAGDPAKLIAASESFQNTSGGVVKAPRPLRVLIAEDNETNRMLAVRLLSKMGHDVTAAENGASAVAVYGAGKFDVILMDMQMPVLDGPGAMRQIRRQERGPARVPIIALTADAMREHHREYLEAGADIIITKPVDWTALAVEMDRLTGGGGSSAKARPAAAPRRAGGALNLSLLEEMFQELSAELPALLENMEHETDRYITALRYHAGNGETELAGRTAHSLKGLASQFGAPRLAAAAARAEQAAKRGESCEPFLAEIEATAGEALAALRAWRTDRIRPSAGTAT